MSRVLLSASRRSPGIPSKSGSHVLYTLSEYSFDTHTESKQLRVLEVKSEACSVIQTSTEITECFWLKDSEVVAWLEQPKDSHTTRIVAACWRNPADRHVVTEIQSRVSGFKLVDFEDGRLGFVVSALQTPTGDLYNGNDSSDSKDETKSSVRTYDTIPERAFDSWLTVNKLSLWLGILMERADQYSMADSLTNLLKGSGLHLSRAGTPLGMVDYYDVGRHGLAFCSDDRTTPKSENPRSCLFYSSWVEWKEGRPGVFQKVDGTVPEHGVCASVNFSSDGAKLAFIKDSPIPDSVPHVLTVADVTQSLIATDTFVGSDGDSLWDACPTNVSWGADGKSLLLRSFEEGREKLFYAQIQGHDHIQLPCAIVNEGSVESSTVLSNGLVFATSSNFVDDSVYTIVDPTVQRPNNIQWTSSKSKNGQLFELSPGQISEFYYESDNGRLIHSWLIKPSTFDVSKKYPLLIMVHGGPQWAWNNTWFTRSNAAIFAEAGFIVMLPNITGSIGWGLELMKSVLGDSGGAPLLDLIAGFDHVEKHYPFVDTANAVLEGASYGGYMANWIQGQDFGRKFKALVTHAGIFSWTGMLSTDMPAGLHSDIGGEIWKCPNDFNNFSPFRYAHNWKTPHLIIHNDLDFRVPITEGLAMFHVLQMKGVESRFINFPDENHWVQKPENLLVWYKEVLAWITRHTGIELVE